MKISFPLPDDGALHRYCIDCTSENTVADQHGRHTTCHNCGRTSLRALIIDPAVEWWIAEDGEYWHETAGVFVFNPAGEMLLFERNKFPLGLTPPAGHVDAGEQPLVSAQRELREEVGINTAIDQFTHVFTEDIAGDGCRRGSDAHRWHGYAITVPNLSVKVDSSEGSQPIWLTPEQALEHPDRLTFATRYVLRRHAGALRRGAR